MKSIFYISLMVFATLFAHAQEKDRSTNQKKKQLDTAAISNWPTVASGIISNNGNYAAYFVAPNGNQASEQFYSQQAVIRSQESNWKYEIRSIIENGLSFSEDSRHAVYRTIDNELWLVKLGAESIKLCDQITGFQLVGYGKENYVLYKTVEDELVCRNINKGAEIRLKGVSDYKISVRQRLVSVVSKESGFAKLLQLNFGDKNPRRIGAFKNVSSLIADEHSGNLCFKSGDQWYVLERSKIEAKSIKLKADENFKGLTFSGIERFEAGGNLLIARFTKFDLTPLNPTVNKLKIFSYQDPEYFTARHQGERQVSSYRAAFDLLTGKLTRLEYPNQQLRTISEDGIKALISHVEGTPDEYYWNKLAEYKGYVLDLVTGQKINAIGKSHYTNKISPDGKWIIGQDVPYGDIISVSTTTGISTSITASLPIPEIDASSMYDMPINRGRGLFFYNWTADNRYIIAYDTYDIWRLDPSGKERPMNLTNGIGRKSHIYFKFIESRSEKYLSNGESVVITAFNDETKENGFYELTIGKPESLKKLTMGPYLYQAPWRIGDKWQPPVKARDANVWLIPRERAEESRNLFLTKDFKTFTALSDNHPERDYNWYTSELVSFKTKDGLNCKAILYKPDNFDPTKRYPVLFTFYQGSDSERLHAYNSPDYTESGYRFNITMMLARGYMVCLTDTRQPVIGETAHGLVDAIEGAADELAKRPYIDSNAYGASGGSFGGYGVNCLAALSSKFNALVSISGISDLVSIYGTVPGNSEEHTENRQHGMGVSLGTDPERYLRNSPIAYSKKVTTPLLIVNTLSDGNVNVQQGIEWFISLRRDGKRAWMLQYQEHGHGVGELANQNDLYQRMNQFFDHYLKGAPAPVWMTRGISINDRGVKDGFELDTEMKTPEPSKLYQGH